MHDAMKMLSSSGAASAVAIAIAATFSLVAFRFLWELSSRRPAAAPVHLTGRRAAVYWYSPTGLQDERGLTQAPVVPVTTLQN